ncbi:MAG: DNA translocase FtsK 4TM domain-containing protein [Bacteroidales bacterium]|nr:DNA translocase FtsK 4TM domain-containing protein [Bacteroidales bacterium]
MAKQEEKPKDKNTEPEIPKKSFFKDERVRFTAGVFMLFLAIYLTIAFISYLFTWQTDQSFEWQNIFSGSGIRVENWTGKIGASFSVQFMNHWFGISSFSLPFIIGLLGLRLLKVRPLPFRKTTFKLLIGTVLLSLVLGFIARTIGGFLGSGLGGAHGLFVSEWISALIGKVGTAFLLLLFCITYTIYVQPDSIHWFNRLIGEVILLFKSKKNEEEVEIEANTTTIKKTIVVNENGQIIEKQDDNKVEEFTSSPAENTNLKVTNNPIIEKADDLDDEDEIEEQELTNEVEEDANVHQIQAVIAPEGEGDVELTIESIQEAVANGSAIENQELYDPTLELSSYQRPPIELLEEYKNQASPVSNEELIDNKNKIVETLANYKIQIDKIKATIGPTVTLYEIVPAPGIRISKIKNLEDDIALSLAALGIRIIAPIPGRGTIGIEVPNQKPEIVSMYSILKSAKFQESKFELLIALGKNISNETFILDLTKLPHLLVAGATGQGKSVGLNAIISSLLYKKHPSQLKFVLIDPKKVELTLYSRLERHFLAKLPDSEEAIITDTQKVIYTLNSLCIEMDQRYELLKQAQVRNIKEYNDKFTARRLNPNKGHKFLPYIVVIIDEFADLIMTAGREVETPLARLAQLARAIGIHLIIATQRPSINIITGVIKANFPARIAFRVSSMIDSRTILDHPGANQLIGRGDMLVSTGSDMVRVQCAFIDVPEIERLTDFISNQRGYATAFLLPEYSPESSEEQFEVDLKKRDDLFDEAAKLIVQYQQGSTSLIQRKFSIGYNRAGRIIDQLEAAGVVGPFEGSKARQVLITDEISLEQIINNLNNQQ